MAGRLLWSPGMNHWCPGVTPSVVEEQMSVRQYVDTVAWIQDQQKS